MCSSSLNNHFNNLSLLWALSILLLKSYKVHFRVVMPQTTLVKKYRPLVILWGKETLRIPKIWGVQEPRESPGKLKSTTLESKFSDFRPALQRLSDKALSTS